MMKFFRRVLWTKFLRPDWYIVGCSDGFIRLLLWNGIIWEDRSQTYTDSQIRWVGQSVPNQNPTVWTFVFEDEVYDGEFETEQKAYDAALDVFHEQCSADGVQQDEAEVELISFVWDRYHEKRIERGRYQATLVYERTPSDYEQHSVWHTGAGGVL